MNMIPPNTGLTPLGTKPAVPQNPGMGRQEITPPKCFGTDYFGKWNTQGMTFESMKVDHPDYQQKCANCPLFERCYMVNHIRLLRIKK